MTEKSTDIEPFSDLHNDHSKRDPYKETKPKKPQPTPTPLLSELREPVRKIMREYYNHTFEFAMEQLKKGDITALIANAEAKQKELDDPYLDQIMQSVTATLRALEQQIPHFNILATKYGYSSDEKKFGYRIAMHEVHDIFTKAIEGKK